MERALDIDARPMIAFRELFATTRRVDRTTVLKAISAASHPDPQAFLYELFDARLWRLSEGGKVIALTDKGVDFCRTRVPIWRQWRQMMR